MFKNHIKKISLLSIFTLSSCSMNNNLEQLEGLYGGIGMQNGKYWVMKINIDRENYSIEYPLISSGSKCYGWLDYSHQSDNSFYFNEKIQYGPCKEGKIHLTRLSNDELEYYWENEAIGKLKKYKTNDALISETTSLFEKYTRDNGSLSMEDTLGLLAGAAVIGGVVCLFADCSGSNDDTSTLSGSLDDDIEACKNKYVGQRISISSGKKNIWGDIYSIEYEVRGVGQTQMTVEEVSDYNISPNVFNLACSTYRFNPHK